MGFASRCVAHAFLSVASIHRAAATGTAAGAYTDTAGLVTGGLLASGTTGHYYTASATGGGTGYTVNPVAGPYFNFTLPEPTGVVGVVAPEKPGLLGLVLRLAPALCGGNTMVGLLSESRPLAGLTLAEVLATSDLPAGVVNLISGRRAELLPWLAGHMNVNAIDAAGCTDEELAAVEKAAADSVKRVVRLSARDALSPYAVTSFMEFKTVWHPIGV